MKHYETICGITDGDVSAEVVSVKFEEIVEEGKALAAFIKISL